MKKTKKFISIIWWYHKQIFSFEKEQNYHMMPLEAMKEQGYECEIFAINSQVKIEDDPNFISWVKVIYYKNIFQYLSYLRRNRNAILYSNSLTIKTLLVGIIGKKTIFMAHDQTLPLESNKWKRKFVLFFYRFFSWIRVINKGESDLLQNYGIKNYILPLSLSKNFFCSNFEHKSWACFVGNLYEDKNPEFLIGVIKKVIEKYPDFILYIAWEDRYFKHNMNFKQLICNEWLEKNIQVLWFIPHSKLKALLWKSLIYINTSVSEGQCLAVYEAVLAWCMLCLQNILSFPTVFEDRAYYHTTKEELTHNILLCLEHQQENIVLVEKNQKMILDHYNYDAIKDKLITLFSF